MTKTKDGTSKEPGISHDHADAQRALKALNAVGGHNVKVILSFIGLATLLALGTNAVYEILKALVPGDDGLAKPVVLLVAVGLAGVVAVSLLREKSARAIEEKRPNVNCKRPDPVRTLVIFASNPTIDRTAVARYRAEHGEIPAERWLAWAEDAFRASGKGAATDAAWRAKLDKHNWRMPLEAIAYHLGLPQPKLKRIVIISSANPPADGGPATIAYLPLMKRLLSEAIEAAGHDVSILGVHELEGLEGRYEPNKYTSLDLSEGVDFEDLELMVWVLFDTYRVLKANYHHRETDVIVDITGGQKPNAVAGAIFAVLVPDRRFQYVSTGSYQVLSYDATHEPMDAA